MTQKRILILILLVMLFNGAVDAVYNARAAEAPLAFTIPLTLCVSFLSFLWYRHDSDARQYRRTPLLNVAMIMLVFFAMPYYLLRSRPRDQKLRALARFAGFAVLMVLSSAAGIVLSGHAV